MAILHNLGMCELSDPTAVLTNAAMTAMFYCPASAKQPAAPARGTHLLKLRERYMHDVILCVASSAGDTHSMRQRH
jgi:hypothetical protein